MADDKKGDAEVQFLPPASQVDLERRLADDYLPDSVILRSDPEEVRAPYAVEGNETAAYRGVSPEYMTYASETEKPYQADEGPEAEAQKRLELGVANVRKIEDLRSEPVTEIGIVNQETVNTVTSGESYTPKVVDAPKDFQGTASHDVDYAGKDQPSAPVAAPKATKAAPAAKSPSNK